MKNIFIDGGGNNCKSVQKYLRLSKFDKVFVFEPNPIFHESYVQSNFELIRKAIWIEDCVKLFYVSKDQNQVASSLIEEKLCKVNSKIVPYWYEKPIQVECIDFSRWLLELSKEDNISITLKLDIEGAEFNVLRKMLDDGTIGLVDKLYVEFHSDTLPSKLEEEKKLIQELKNYGVPANDWD